LRLSFATSEVKEEADDLCRNSCLFRH